MHKLELFFTELIFEVMHNEIPLEIRASQETVPLGNIPFSTLHQICSIQIQMYFKYLCSLVLHVYPIKYR